MIFKMENFFAKPTPKKVAEKIYNEVILVHETGGRFYRYPVSNFSISFINEVIDRLSEYVHDADVLELEYGYIVIEWS
jgi:hypothetical protein